MKTIRNIAGVLLILDALLHLLIYFNSSGDSGNMGILVFGIIYLIIGALLFTPKRYPLYLGFFMPIVGITLSIIGFGLPELISLSMLYKVFGLAAVVCCAILLFRQHQHTRTEHVSV